MSMKVNTHSFSSLAVLALKVGFYTQKMDGLNFEIIHLTLE